MKHELFTVRQGKMLMWRVGPLSSRTQKHWRVEGTIQPPVKKGVWAFPYPHYTLFFVSTSWEKLLPKKFQGETWEAYYNNLDREEQSAAWIEREVAYDKVVRIHKPKKFWFGSQFFSHISPSGVVDQKGWFLWDSVKMWAKEAQKHIVCRDRWQDEVYSIRCSKDHFELFLPAYRV